MSQAEIAQAAHSTWNEHRPVTASLLILRGLTVGGWIVAEGILLLSLLGIGWSVLQG